jgi:hypothetical protein
MFVEIISELIELALEISCVSEEELIKIFATCGSDKAFEERMRNGCQRNRIDWVYHHSLEFRCPTVETVEWIVVQAQVLGSNPVVFGTKVEEGGKGYFSRCGALYERHSSK